MKWISKRKKQGRQKRGCCCLFTLIVLASILACAALFVLLYHAYAQGEGKSQTGGRWLYRAGWSGSLLPWYPHGDSGWLGR